MSGITTMLGGGTGPATGTFATTCTPGPWHIARMIEAADAFPMNLAFTGKGNASTARRARGDDPGRRLRAEAARGLGHDAGRHRLLPVGCGCLRRAGDDPHRYAQRIRLRRGYDRGLQGPHDPRLPHGRRGRRARAGHHQGGGASQRAAVLHQPDPALYGEHHRRASRHAHGLPPPRSRRSRRISPSPRAASARRPSRPRTSCTISARSR